MPQEQANVPDLERIVVLVKALPHVGDKHGETVCCAGVTSDGTWRRLFPVNFRSLDRKSQFARWHWIEYRWRKPRDDHRPESQRVQENTIRVLHSLHNKDRGALLNRLLRPSVHEAEARGETLTLIRPLDTKFTWKKKTAEQLEEQAREYSAAANQFSLFGENMRPLIPCPYEFKYQYRTSDGKSHTSTCDDWETYATYFRFERLYGAEKALEHLSETFGRKYKNDGMAFAMGTHSRYPQVWLLVGVLRLDESSQSELKL